ncbi:GNAT family N-acetyltransferase [Brevibacterium sp. BRM-1]|uniref:GNAT family N-acetyltransferase n=1 Tax=Brevibacterium sp. BRM-1 TaxID=2999062 RepID=UPI0022818743|nr:GNAT family N-acetyltransferase [Brevibacterium sp. BRM-1]WAL40075.1 GNAT family N-acetyltransferase [Brevibacterium sp. BRM-1]
MSDERSTEQTAGGVTVAHNEARERFEGRLGDELAGYAAYADANGVRDFNHTVTFPQFSGRGVAGAIVSAALDATVAAGLKIHPSCSYVDAYVRKHREWDDALV